jgi:two-component system, sensor histidine kinase FlrB
MLPAAMTSLPMSACLPIAVAMRQAASPRESQETARGDGEQFLLQAFRTFSEAADSLERSYGVLRSEVARLHGELEQSNAGLRRSLEENRQMRHHLDRILDGLPCGVLVAEPDGAISLANPEARRLLGPPEATGEAASACGSLALQSLELVSGELRDLLQRARSEPGEQEQCIADGCGGERWLAVRHAAVKDGQADRGPGTHAGDEQKSNNVEKNAADCVSIFILRDISDAKKLVEERDKMRREQALAEMSAILAHEIRNPLGSLELFAGLLAGAGLSAECRQWVEQVQAGLRTLAATVNNVLHFHSLPAPERAPTDLGQLLDWAGGFLVPMARQARVELCLHNRLQGVCFAADRHRLEQVLLNLALNAFRAMPGGGWVEISGKKVRHEEKAAVEISVNDTGPGVFAGQTTKIFEAGCSTHSGSPGLGSQCAARSSNNTGDGSKPRTARAREQASL